MSTLPPPLPRRPRLEPAERTQWREVAMWLAVGVAAIGTALAFGLF